MRFLSLVLIIQNQSEMLRSIIERAATTLSSLAKDYEIIIVDNASSDNSVATLKHLTGENGVPNLQVYVLTKEVDADTASWVGVENALGDYVAVLDPTIDDMDFLPKLLEKVREGIDVAFAINMEKPRTSLAYRVCFVLFDYFYKLVNGFRIVKDAPLYRVLSKKVINFVLQHPVPSLTYRYLPITAGFTRASLTYKSKPKIHKIKKLGDSIDRGIRILVSTTRVPMRLVTFLSVFGAIANILYSIYVIGVGLLKADVTPGWISLSLQQSGMFFLISLVLLVLGEYILYMASLSYETPAYHVAQEFTSTVMEWREKLNLEVNSEESAIKPPASI